MSGKKVSIILFLLIFLLPSLVHSQTISLDFKDADIRNVLRILAKQNNLNIIAGKEVVGSVTVHLSKVTLENALHSILAINGFSYEKVGNIYLVSSEANIIARKKSAFATGELITEIFQLKYIGAEDIKGIIAKQLSPRGSVEVLSKLIQGGWEMGGVSTGEKEMGKKTRVISEKEKRPTILVVTDVPKVLEKVKKLIASLDVKPEQILIEAMLVEVSSDAVRDIGIQWSTSEVGYTEGTGHGGVDFGLDTGTPSISSGLSLAYDTIGEEILRVKIQALEEEKKANVLSHPKIMTLSGHEAVIIVGERYPIMTTSYETTTGVPVYTGALDHYEPIGISLRVIPTVTEKGWVNMLIHPEVTSLGENVTAGSEEGVLTLPRIKSRETDTNVTVREGETVVIGGLKSETLEENVYKVPLLGDIPILGYLFKRTEKKPRKVDLLIFITPHIVKEAKLSPEEKERLKSPLK